MRGYRLEELCRVSYVRTMAASPPSHKTISGLIAVDVATYLCDYARAFDSKVASASLKVDNIQSRRFDFDLNVIVAH